MTVVVDTNVWAVAARLQPQASDACVDACEARLQGLANSGRLAVDRNHRILAEYWDVLEKAERSLPAQLLGKMVRSGRVDRRPCEWEPQAQGVAVVPEALQCLDPSDRKFAAVALTYSPPAPIWNATDRDWSECATACKAVGLKIVELCREAIRS